MLWRSLFISAFIILITKMLIKTCTAERKSGCLYVIKLTQVTVFSWNILLSGIEFFRCCGTFFQWYFFRHLLQFFFASTIFFFLIDLVEPFLYWELVNTYFTNSVDHEKMLQYAASHHGLP